LIVLELGAGLRPRRAPHDLRAVGVEERAAVVARLGRQTFDVLAVFVHAVQVDVAVAHRREDDAAIAPAHGAFGIVARRLGQPRDLTAVCFCREDVVAVVDRPDVTLAHVGLRWALGPCQVRRRVQQMLAVGKEVRACRRALTTRDLRGRDTRHRVAMVEDRHRVDPIAADVVCAPLQRHALTVEAKIRLGVFAAERQLGQLAEPPFLRGVGGAGRGSARGVRCRGAGVRARREHAR
jgi:hypothetical protein